MSKIEEKIEAAWQRSRGEEKYDPGYPVKASSNFADGYKAGAADALSHQWVSVEDELPPNNEDVLVALVNGNYTFVGVAWCSKGSNGTKRWYSDDENLNMDFVKFWMPIPPLPETRKEDEVC